MLFSILQPHSVVRPCSACSAAAWRAITLRGQSSAATVARGGLLTASRTRCVLTTGRFPKVKISISFAGIAGVLLLFGLGYYVAFRTALPAPLQYLHVRPLGLAGSVDGGGFPGSLPSMIHVTAFTLLTCALLRPSVLSALVAGAAWAGVGVLWEFSCADHQAWLRRAGELIGVNSVPACTYDNWDIVASIAGAAAATGIAWLVLKFYSVPYSTA